MERSVSEEKKVGRPLIEINKEEFEKLCSIFCTLDDIAGWFRCSPDTIERFCKREYDENFADILKRYSSNAKVSLRRKQIEAAQKGNITMLIWLGKQHLEQRDKIENDNINLNINSSLADRMAKARNRIEKK